MQISIVYLLLLPVLVLNMGCKKGGTRDLRTPASPVSEDPQQAGPSGPATPADANSEAKGSKLSFINIDVVQATKSCGLLSVEIQDSSGNFVPTSASMTLDLSSSSGTGAFYSDDKCTTAIKTIVIAAGSAEAITYYKDPTIGTAAITIADSSASGLGKATGNVIIAAVAKLKFIAETLNQTTADCGFVDLEAQNAEGKGINIGESMTLNLSSSSATGAFFSDAACTTAVTTVTIEPGNSVSSSIYFKDPTVGTATLSATEAPAAGLTPASMTATITAN